MSIANGYDCCSRRGAPCLSDEITDTPALPDCFRGPEGTDMKSMALFAVVLLSMTAVQAQEKHGVVSGTITKIDSSAKTVTIKTATGTEVVAKETAQTVKHGAAATKVGGQVVVHYTMTGADRTAVAIKGVGDKTVHVAEGTVDKVDDAAKTVAVKTTAGSVVVFHAAEDGVVNAGGAVKEGGHVTVHYTEEGVRKTAHAFSAL